MRKIYFIEGLPGSGKTTMARRLSEYLRFLGEDVVFYNEGDLHPVDLAWIAILREEELLDLIKRYPSLEKPIKANIRRFKDKYHLAYTLVDIDILTKDFYDYCLQYEIYQIEDEVLFLEEHLNLWKAFFEETKDYDKTYVFECIFLQNHINELLLKYDLSIDDIVEYYERFQEVLKGNKVQVIYIKQLDIENTLKRITEERRTNDKTLYKDWIDHVIEYVESSTFGKTKNYYGYQGTLEYFKDRQAIELKVLDQLKINKTVINLENDYQEVFSEIVKKII
ncbi:MAG: hypothetical protein CVV60_04555 [Tenericutes bacterium HGW-Tenericutes-5]|nr:MAG: hypothetical protein CVV60_04555 [Tenericutes bacterium HGW-Tenericutes-5]